MIDRSTTLESAVNKSFVCSTASMTLLALVCYTMSRAFSLKRFRIACTYTLCSSCLLPLKCRIIGWM